MRKPGSCWEDWLRGHATSVVCTLTMRSFRPFLAVKFKAP